MGTKGRTPLLWRTTILILFPHVTLSAYNMTAASLVRSKPNFSKTSGQRTAEGQPVLQRSHVHLRTSTKHFETQGHLLSRNMSRYATTQSKHGSLSPSFASDKMMASNQQFGSGAMKNHPTPSPDEDIVYCKSISKAAFLVKQAAGGAHVNDTQERKRLIASAIDILSKAYHCQFNETCFTRSSVQQQGNCSDAFLNPQTLLDHGQWLVGEIYYCGMDLRPIDTHIRLAVMDLKEQVPSSGVKRKNSTMIENTSCGLHDEMTDNQGWSGSAAVGDEGSTHLDKNCSALLSGSGHGTSENVSSRQTRSANNTVLFPCV